MTERAATLTDRQGGTKLPMVAERLMHLLKLVYYHREYTVADINSDVQEWKTHLGGIWLPESEYHLHIKKKRCHWWTTWRHLVRAATYPLPFVQRVLSWVKQVICTAHPCLKAISLNMGLTLWALGFTSLYKKKLNKSFDNRAVVMSIQCQLHAPKCFPQLVTLPWYIFQTARILIGPNWNYLTGIKFSLPYAISLRAAFLNTSFETTVFATFQLAVWLMPRDAANG